MDSPSKQTPEPEPDLAKKPPNPESHPTAEPEPEAEDDQILPGILPERDLKKNLGCG